MSDRQYSQSTRTLVVVWTATAPVLFLVLALLGLTMRLNQAGAINVDPALFYAIMTVHGLGMAGTTFVAGFAVLTYFLARYIRVSLAVGWTMYGLTLVGVVGLVAATLIGKFGPGWYLLYPLPFQSNGTWPDWALGLAVASLIVLGVGWLLGQVDVARALVAKYGLVNCFAWQYLRGGSPEKVEIPPIVLVAMAGCLVPGILTTFDGAVLLMLYLFKWFSPTVAFDPLLLKNAVFLWGHTLVNITMYVGLAMVYELLPKYSGKPWKTNAIIALSWNAVMFLVLFAFFHHLYMDYVQPIGLQYLGQIASYASAIPATVVTVFGVISQVYGSGMRWRFVPLAMFLGTVGWVIGGFAAVVDSTIAVNVVFHNTLWVPAHFHTYFLVGYLLLLWGVLFEVSGSQREGVAKAGLWLFVAGAYGFLATFYLGGALSVPRRFADYTSIPVPSLASAAERLASVSAIAISVLLLGLILLFATIYAALLKRSVPGEATPTRA